jgi:hypothetical protein
MLILADGIVNAALHPQGSRQIHPYRGRIGYQTYRSLKWLQRSSRVAEFDENQSEIIVSVGKVRREFCRCRTVLLCLVELLQP